MKMIEGMEKVPMETITNPTASVVRVIRNHWWAVTDNNEVLIYKKHSLQCNSNKSIMEHMAHEGTHPVLIPLAFVSYDDRDR